MAVATAVSYVAEELIKAAAAALAGGIVGGVIQMAVATRYYVEISRYYIKAVDPVSGTTRIYKAIAVGWSWERKKCDELFL